VRQGSRRGSAAAPVTLRLQDLAETGAIAADPLQLHAAATLDRIAHELGEKPRNGGLLKLIARPQAVRGAYIVGAVGRGKTMLMDTFFALAPLPHRAKRRVHFHEFMDEVHAAIAKFRRTPKGKAESADPVAAAVGMVLKDTRLLCLDEFQVQDITNAMLLGRLFERLLDAGVTIVATSNTAPDELYANGLNRQLFLPAIARLKEALEIVPLDGPTDYRRLKFEGEAVFVFGTGAKAQAAMDRLWLKLTGGVPGEPEAIHSLGRTIHVPQAAMGAARFAFAELCETPLGARDYLRLAHAYDTLMIDGVPRFSRANSDAAKRFILLVDTLYDRGIKLAASFAAPLDELGQDDRTAADFGRTVSRLIEMHSAEYLSAPRKAEAGEVSPAG
jgi:cell division protein ZapE